MKKILIINGHPNPDSYCHSLHQAYIDGATSSNAEIQSIKVNEITFNSNLAHGYTKRTELEPDLLDAQEKIKWADHLVIIYPIWWGSYPGIFKGFLDRVLLPGFAFQKRENSVWWDKLLKGKTGRIISTADQPAWYYKWINKEPSNVAMKKLTLNFIGIKKVKTTTIGPIRNSSDSFRKKWIDKVFNYGKKMN